MQLTLELHACFAFRLEKIINRQSSNNTNSRSPSNKIIEIGIESLELLVIE